MDQYKASIESVDNALNRLNQTLASYRLLSSQSANAKREETPEPSPPAKPQQPAQATSPRDHGVPPVAGTRDPKTAARSITPIEKIARDLRASQVSQLSVQTNKARLQRVQEAYARLAEDPYCLPLHLVLARIYLVMGYPDLAAGTAYKALLLSDALDNEAEEYHNEASDSLKAIIQQQPLEERIQVIRRAMDAELQNATPSELDPALDVEITLWLKEHYRIIMYRLLTRSLLLVGCLRSALTFAKQATQLYPEDPEMKTLMQGILDSGAEQNPPLDEECAINEWPDEGFARREKYAWNTNEPDRFAELEYINGFMSECSDKVEVRAVDLPDLPGGNPDGISRQLGVFAKQDIEPGEVVLTEISFLTANNKLQDALCDACCSDLPELGTPEYENVMTCEECEVVFCNEYCYKEAMYLYHPSVCGKDVEAIAKDVPPAEAADALYSLLLLRVLAMSEQQDIHPLEVDEIKYIWGDFSKSPDLGQIVYENLDSPDSCLVPRTLPFSFEHNIRLPFHMLEKMDVDIFAEPACHEVWVFNTLYAKFRGTASARLSGLGGRAIRGPEVSAVHPMWCLANHSCDPNVTWEWGANVTFTARETGVGWREKGGKIWHSTKKGIKKDEEILNHYCDIDLPVRDRREWARGALGGDCCCHRCCFEIIELEEEEQEAEDAAEEEAAAAPS